MMFRKILLFLATYTCLWGAVCFAVPLTDLANKHNLSNLSTNSIKAQPVGTGGTDQICIFCHTPHSATPDSPLWSRPDPAFTGSFPLYGQDLVIKGTRVGTGSNAGDQVTHSEYTANPATYPSGASRLCLSCHDGITAIGLLNDNTSINMLSGTTLNDFPAAVASGMVIDLSTSHPISFKYDTAVLADLTAFYGAGAYTLPSLLDAVDTPLDGQDRMQCTTCHDPHNDTRIAINIPFWRQTSGTTQYDDVCNACHASTPGLLGTNH